MTTMKFYPEPEKLINHIQSHLKTTHSQGHGLQFLEDCYSTLDGIYMFMKSECPQAVAESNMLLEARKIIKYHLDTIPQVMYDELTDK